MEQLQKQVASLKSSEVYLSIDIKYVGMVTKGSTQKKSIQKCHMLRKFSASVVGPWLGEQVSLIYLCILSAHFFPLLPLNYFPHVDTAKMNFSLFKT